MAYTTIDNPTNYFETLIWTGDGNSSRNITDLSFQPDWIWFKRRNATGHNRLIDSVRGSNKLLQTDLTNAEGTDATYVTSFNSDGFSIGNNTDINNSGTTVVAWNWKAGTAFSNSAGANGATLASSGSKNDTAGFSIVSYTGDESGNDTIFHGLSQTPELIITKPRDVADNWGFFHGSFSSQEYMFFNTTSAKADASSMFNALPGSTVFTVGDNAAVNDNGAMIAYCFHSVKGYSKFGSYKGNGNDDGVFIYTGFKPAFVITRQTNGGNYWHIHDNKRNSFNVVNTQLFVDRNVAEETPSSGENARDFLSNGFKFRDSDHNNSSQSYIYMAFAESPFVTSGGVPTTAR